MYYLASEESTDLCKKGIVGREYLQGIQSGQWN